MLQGERVLLRPMRESDTLRQYEFDQDIELYLLDSSHPQVTSMERTRAFYESRVAHNERIAPFAIEVDGVYIGYCSLMDIGHWRGNLDLGIMIGDRAYHGRGYGRETVRLLLHFGFHYLGARRIALTTHEKNERAIRCYAACGFVEEGRPRKVVWVNGEFVDLVNMSILRDEWARDGTPHDSRAPSL